jgi:hypothetical protein
VRLLLRAVVAPDGQFGPHAQRMHETEVATPRTHRTPTLLTPMIPSSPSPFDPKELSVSGLPTKMTSSSGTPAAIAYQRTFATRGPSDRPPLKGTASRPANFSRAARLRLRAVFPGLITCPPLNLFVLPVLTYRSLPGLPWAASRPAPCRRVSETRHYARTHRGRRPYR